MEWSCSPGNVTGQVVQKFVRRTTKVLEQINGPNVSLYSRSCIFAPKWEETANIFKNEQILATKRRIHQRWINNIDNDKYSIIITRHPIDVLRMSDFDNITSCHSPASRTSAYQSYYKCAVAEAQGHGAVAYVVETEDLL